MRHVISPVALPAPALPSSPRVQIRREFLIKSIRDAHKPSSLSYLLLTDGGHCGFPQSHRCLIRYLILWDQLSTHLWEKSLSETASQVVVINSL